MSFFPIKAKSQNIRKGLGGKVPKTCFLSYTLIFGLACSRSKISAYSQDSYISPRDIIFPQCCALRDINMIPWENITLLAVHRSSRRLRVLGKKYIKRLLTVNTMYYMKPQKANLKVMDPWPLRSLLSLLISYSLYLYSSRSKIFNDRCMSLKVDFWSGWLYILKIKISLIK